MMNITLDCFPCFVRQLVDATRFSTSDLQQQERIVRTVLHQLTSEPLPESPPLLAQKVHRMIREQTSNPDPYLEAKQKSNRLMLDRLDDLRLAIQQSNEPWESAVRLAICGNMIDFAFKSSFSDEFIDQSIDAAMSGPLLGDQAIGTGESLHPDVERLIGDVASSGSILYVADNAGEIVCDRLLIEQHFPLDRTTLAVRGYPVLNDATRDDARDVGLTDLVETIDTGSDAPGVIIEDCSSEFRKRFESADLIIAKGLANYETMLDCPRDIWFLFKAKCDVIARMLDVPVGSLMIRRNERE